MEINQSAIHGEPQTGYEGPEKGPFECANCEYFRKSDNSCGQKDMMAHSKRAKLKDGRVKVEPKGCCEFVSRIGQKSLRKIGRNWLRSGNAK